MEEVEAAEYIARLEAQCAMMNRELHIQAITIEKLRKELEELNGSERGGRRLKEVSGD